MNILTNAPSPSRNVISSRSTVPQAAETAGSGQDPSLFDSVTTGMTDIIAYQARPALTIAGAFAGVHAGLGLAKMAVNALPVEAAIPGLVLAGAIGLGAAVVGGKVAWEVSPTLVSTAIEQSESLAAKMHLPKGTGKLVASAAWLGSVGSSVGAGGGLGMVSSAATVVTGLMIGVGAASGAMTYHQAQEKASAPAT
jgi:hypothetical protein